MLSRGDSHLITLPSAAEGELLLGIHWVYSLRAVLLFNAELHGGLCGVLLTDELSELLEIFSVSGGNLWKEVGFQARLVMLSLVHPLLSREAQGVMTCWFF